MTALATATMSSPQRHSDPERSHESDGTSGYEISHHAQHTPATGHRTAAGTIGSVFASLWGSYNQPPPRFPSQNQKRHEQQQRESGPSRLQSPSIYSTPNESPSPSIPGAWGNLLSWGPSAGQQKTSALRKPSSPSPVTPSKAGRSRNAIPFSISAPLEASNAEKVETDRPNVTHRPQTRADTMASRTLSPTSSPRRKPLAGIFEDASSSPISPPHTPVSPGRQSRDLPPLSPSLEEDSPGGAYATLSRLQSKPSTSKLRSGSGFLWPSAATNTVSSDKMHVATVRHGAAANWSDAIAKAEKLDSHVRRIIFQAGLDYETRPMVVLAACFLPDPNEVDYDALLDRIMDAMDLFVENDYTVVYFASGGHHKPGWNWIWRAYRRLDRRFRKNLKRLYIVHPTFFTSSLLRFVNTGSYIISPKFSKKVSQLNTLSALAEHVPLTQIDIPPEVLQWNLKYEKHVTLSAKPDSVSDKAGSESDKVFGVDLVRLMGEFGESGGVPRVVRDCVGAIMGDFDGIRPAEVEGIFRRSPSSALLKAAEESYDRGHPVSLEQYRDPHIPAVLLKVFLRKLPQPIFPSSLYGMIRACPRPPLSAAIDGEQANAQARETIDYLRARLLPAIEPACNGLLLSYVLELLHKVSQHHKTNRMDAANLATVIAPNLVSSGNAMKDMLICRVEGIGSMSTPSSSAQSSPQIGRSPHVRKASVSSNADQTTTLGSILRFCIERYYEIFDEMPFATQVNNVQSVVDSSPYAHRELGSALVNGSPPVRVRDISPRMPSTPVSTASGRGLGLSTHRRGESTTSEVSQTSSAFLANPSPSVLADADVDDTSSRTATTPSLASRENHRLSPAFRSTIGRNSSGSLRLTKGRLGSNNNLRSSFTAVRPVSGLASPGVGMGVDTDGLTSQLSGVSLTGVSAAGTFSSPGGKRVAEQMVGEPSRSASGSPVLVSSGWKSLHRQQQQDDHEVDAQETDTLASTSAVVKSRSLRRDLSEVREVQDDS